MPKRTITYCLLIFAFLSIGNVGKAFDISPMDNGLTEKAELTTIEIVDVYPNPATDHIFLKFEEAKALDAKVEIRSVIGNQMNITYKAEDSSLIKVDISQLPAGHYYAVVTYDQQKVLKKFIKR